MTKGDRVRRWWLLCLALAACAAPRDVQREVEEMLSRSAGDWNRGELAGFMSDYAHDSLTSYVASGRVQYGWQALYDRYQRTYFSPGQSRDSLTFEDVAARRLGPRAALATARFALRRADSVVASGPFTLVLMERGGRWLIIHDHTSSDPKP